MNATRTLTDLYVECAAAALASRRNLYRLNDRSGRLLAYVTGESAANAVERYAANGGQVARDAVDAEQLSFGHPDDMVSVYH